MKNIEEIKAQLDASILKYKDLSKPMKVDNIKNNELFVYYQNPLSDNKILVRESVARLLTSADIILRSYGYSLKVLCGYRSLEEQKNRFNELYKKIKISNPQISEEDLLEEVHKFIAVPTVAGHPTGGATDVTLIDNKTGLTIDMGSAYCDFDDINVYAKSPYISEQVKKNRKLLRMTMLSVGFAPFDGEWWHYSFGDKEWAVYRNQEKYFYDQIELKECDKRIYNEEMLNNLER